MSKAKQTIEGMSRGPGGGGLGWAIRAAVGLGGIGFLGYNGLFNGARRAVECAARVLGGWLPDLRSFRRMSSTRTCHLRSRRSPSTNLTLAPDLPSVLAVEGGHRAVMYNRIVGVKPTVYQEGTHFKIPFIEREIIFDVRQRPRTVSSTTGSRGK